MIIIRPTQENAGGEFAEQISADLIKQGYNGIDLLEQFKKAQKEIRPAVERMLEKASEAACGQDDCFAYNDVFSMQE